MVLTPLWTSCARTLLTRHEKIPLLAIRWFHDPSWGKYYTHWCTVTLLRPGGESGKCIIALHTKHGLLYCGVLRPTMTYCEYRCLEVALIMQQIAPQLSETPVGLLWPTQQLCLSSPVRLSI